MDKAAIEQFIFERIRAAVEITAAECVRQLNAGGHSFANTSDGLVWIDENADEILEVTCPIGVGISSLDEAILPPDAATEKFMTLALSGSDKAATVLFRFEGDLANGGFGQLFENKGVGFVREAIGYLQDIGASAAAKITLQALEIHEQRQPVVREYEQLQADLERLDRRFTRLGIDIPTLYAHFTSKT
ncbi:MAG TPA: hypothetical protein DHV59_17745 [Oxalobacteraceae bacterium]|nr:hypothetical protein [Oxalobacteraceae bacterium]